MIFFWRNHRGRATFGGRRKLQPVAARGCLTCGHEFLTGSHRGPIAVPIVVGLSSFDLQASGLPSLGLCIGPPEFNSDSHPV